MHILDVFPKLNIFLKIIGIDSRGYHLLDSRFCLARGGLKDCIMIKPSNFFFIKGNFDCALEDNTIYRAIMALKKFLELRGISSAPLHSIAIEVEKHIPTGAGLGGGSANAGAVLYYLNEEFFHLPLQDLYFIGRDIGADVPFFISQYVSANVYGIGDVLEEFKEEALEFEILTPKIHCETKKVYMQFDHKKQKKTLLSYSYQKFATKNSLDILKLYDRRQLNDLLSPAMQIYPQLRNFEKNLGDEWFFSGSGSSFFRLRGKI